ncbi:Protocadherin Fat 3 [Manis pentadactyla]|nr:Protocadherin Fat 3 [Manis pentadactyla]
MSKAPFQIRNSAASPAALSAEGFWALLSGAVHTQKSLSLRVAGLKPDARASVTHRGDHADVGAPTLAPRLPRASDAPRSALARRGGRRPSRKGGVGMEPAAAVETRTGAAA